MGSSQNEFGYSYIGDVVVTSSIAVARKTPVAVSSVTPDFLENKIGTQELPEILKSTPGYLRLNPVVVMVILKSIYVVSKVLMSP